VKPSATQDQLNKAYRKKSRDVHPDKARQKFIANYAQIQKKKKGGKPGVKVSKKPSKREIDAHVKEVTMAYQRLTVIADILKGPSRERYDHFLKNGFPKWKGTGYYYERFRPGLGSVMLGMLVVMGGGMHYFALVMSWKRRRDFAMRFIKNARRMAWGDDTGIQGIPGVDTPPPDVKPQQVDSSDEAMAPMNRRQKRMMDKENRKEKKIKVAKPARRSGVSTPVESEPGVGPQGAKRRVVADNGKVLVVDSIGQVFLEEETEDGVRQEFLLDVCYTSPLLCCAC
jgi:curved DNA-binding protein CbpA